METILCKMGLLIEQSSKNKIANESEHISTLSSFKFVNEFDNTRTRTGLKTPDIRS